MTRSPSVRLRCARPLLFAALCLSLVGCAARTSMNRGHALAQAGSWDDALTQYEDAYRRNPSLEGLDSALDTARAAIAARYLEEAQAALNRGDWEAAWPLQQKVTELVPELEHPPALVEAAARAMLHDVHELVKRHELGVAYPLAAQILARYPEAPEGPAAAVTVRETAFQSAQEFQELGAWAEARELLRLVLQYEPNRAQVTGVAIRDLERDWAEQLRTEARNATKRKDWGTAFVQQAHAAHLSGREADRTQRDVLRDKLLDTHGFGLTLDIRGDEVRVSELHQIARRALGSGVRHGVPSPHVRLSLTLGLARCVDTLRTEVGKHLYVAEVVRTRNPEFQRRQVVLAQAESAYSAAASAHADATAAVGSRRHELDAQYGALAATVDALRLAERRAVEQRAAYSQAEKRLTEWIQEVDRVTASGEPVQPAVDGYTQARRGFLATRNALGQALQAEVSARGEWAGLRDAIHRAEGEVAPFETAQRLPADELNSTSLHVSEARALAAEVPAFIETERMAEYRYPVEHHTRSCAVQLEGSVRTAAGKTRLSLAGTASVTDSSHAASVQHGIDQDPLDFAHSDAALSSAAFADLHASLAKALLAHQSAWAEANRRQAERSRDPEAVLSARLVSWLTVEGEADEALRALLLSDYDVDEPKGLIES